ncbi:xanthine dehydrogenase family protein molybdopterin-binding subunit [Ralstonia sp.]|uniref:xanthine dehydrogenase family protein molybdopterin-binding subunit n=1 Tax=Ralstonia sp. TaxID=54061 RepID=UPI002CF233E0|nr:xanthine dehydrogenase family protein molybdopterin-binding subunit [Ralstonia sp.]HWV07464.1 xanthine dehydrogenase family protein molybdopterin-binding subunit [Ralstonia sp.]
MPTRHLGNRSQRANADTLLRGEGRFVDDIPLSAPLYAAFVRSPHARARIRSIDVRAAKAHPGVWAVYTAADIGALDMEFPILIPHPMIVGGRTQRPLARDDVFYVGQTVAMIVATSRYIAEDAAACVDVDYEPLTVEVDLRAAAAPGAPLVHADVAGNIGAHFLQTAGDLPAAIARAEHVTRICVCVERSTAAPLEPRAVAAAFDNRTGELTVWDTTQAPIAVRSGLASFLNIDEHKLRVIAPNVGGGFGQKLLFFYPDEVLVPFAAMQLGRPVKFVEDRRENFIGSTQERGQLHELTLYAMRDGEVVGLHDTFLHDSGAFMPYGIIVAHVSATSIAGPYRIPNLHVEFKSIYTPTVPVTPYRGCGRPHACFAIERAMDQLAEELGLDRFEIRRRNLVSDNEFPYRRDGLIFQDGAPVELDSGQYHRALQTVRDRLDLPRFQIEQAAARAHGRCLGLGLAFYVEGTGLGPYEGAAARIHPITGKIHLVVGVTSQGQGHETAFAQIVADQMGVGLGDILFVQGDTRAFDWGVGTYASRAAVVAGNAVYAAAKSLRARTIDAAARMFGVPPAQVVLRNGHAWSADGQQSASLATVATMANPLRYAFNDAAKAATQFAATYAAGGGPALAAGQQPGLEVREFFSPKQATWGYGVHAAVVEIDIELGHVEILRYITVHDCGTMINPAIVEGQVMGGIAQGLGGALYERIEYDALGRPQNANYAEFLMPYASEMPAIELVHMETPSPLNPLGTKGVGEAGGIAVGAALASAIQDAVAHLGAAKFHQLPITPEMICRAVAAPIAPVAPGQAQAGSPWVR